MFVVTQPLRSSNTDKTVTRINTKRKLRLEAYTNVLKSLKYGKADFSPPGLCSFRMPESLQQNRMIWFCPYTHSKTKKGNYGPCAFADTTRCALCSMLCWSPRHFSFTIIPNSVHIYMIVNTCFPSNRLLTQFVLLTL